MKMGTRESSHVQPAQSEGNQEGSLEEVRILGRAKAHRSPQKADLFSLKFLEVTGDLKDFRGRVLNKQNGYSEKFLRLSGPAP